MCVCVCVCMCYGFRDSISYSLLVARVQGDKRSVEKGIKQQKVLTLKQVMI